MQFEYNISRRGCIQTKMRMPYNVIDQRDYDAVAHTVFIANACAPHRNQEWVILQRWPMILTTNR